MPDSITPVGAMVNPSQQGLQSLSNILGIQQQRQELQKQAIAIQTGQAESQQAQQQNTELQGLAQFTKKAVSDPSYQLSDGSPDVAKFQQDAMAVAPTYGQAYIGNMTSNFKEATLTRQAVKNLSNDQNTSILGMLQGIASNPDARQWDVTKAVEQQRANNQDPGYNAALTHAAGMIDPKDVPGSAAKAAAGLGALMQKPSTIETPVGIQPGATNVYTGQFNPAGPNVPKPLGATVASGPGGIPFVMGGPGHLGAAPAKGPAATGPAPTDQDLNRHNAYETNLNSRVAIGSDLLPRLQLINQAADAIRSGGGTKTRADIAKALQGANAPQALVDAVAGGNLAGVQEAEKLMFQTTFSGLRQSMQGDPARVAEFEAADKVFPNIDTDPRARRQVLGFMAEQSQRDYAEQQALNTSKFNGTFNAATWQGQYQKQLRGGAVPGVPKSQVPETPGVKAMPSGDKLDTYAKTYFSGDTAKAKAFLSSHGYQ